MYHHIRRNGYRMTCKELSDRIRSWVWLYKNSPFPVSSDPIITNYTETEAQKWTREMLADVAKFEEPIELMWTAAGDDLQKAIDYGLLRDQTRLREIHDLLAAVEKYIIANHLIQKK